MFAVGRGDTTNGIEYRRPCKDKEKQLEGHMFRKTAAWSWALVLALAAGAPMSALATEDVSDETVLDTQTEIIDIAEQGTSSGSGASDSGNNNSSSNNNGGSRASSPVSSTGRTSTTTSKTSTPSTGDPTSVIVPAALAAAAVGAFVVAKARRD